ncbi:putative baseplate assembly protein [Nitrosomonas sp.]|uniref:putative baseplate assembly protein n=1 Tax=Nitrosomonas sp. TaxID=42353 RepID=UPI0025CF7233|nr:putative baseplate assembly protein [Nitrosomonas sp.]
MIGKKCGCTTESCGCCEGVQVLTPMSTTNRPGLNSLSYRIGTHGAFLETMKARFASMGWTETDSNGHSPTSIRPLSGLTTRDASDPAIALLDGWATVADVLTFYQERIANECYLRTATERRSVLELARLVGYSLRPGVSASVFLAYTVDDNQKEPVVINPDARAQSIPEGPGELPQAFETSEQLVARAEWSNLQARVTQPQVIVSAAAAGMTITLTDTLYIQGVSTGLKANDPLLLKFESENVNTLVYVKAIEADFPNNRTKVVLTEKAIYKVLLHSPAKQNASRKQAASVNPDPVFDTLVQPLSVPPEPQFASSAFLPRTLKNSFKQSSDSLPQLVSFLKPTIADMLYPAWSNAITIPATPPKIYAFRVKAAPFGSTAPPKQITDDKGKVVGSEEWPLAGGVTVGVKASAGELMDILAQGGSIGGMLVELSVNDGNHSVSVKTNLENTNIRFKLDKSTIWEAKIEVIQIGGTQEQKRSVTFNFSSGTNINKVKITSEDSESETFTVNGDTVGRGESIRYRGNNGDISIEYSSGQRQPETLIFSQQTALLPNFNIIDLDAQYDQIVADTPVVVVRSNNGEPLFSSIISSKNIAKTAYNISGKSTELELKKDWLSKRDLYLSDVRDTTVYAQSEELQLSEMPVLGDNPANPPEVKGDTIELQQLYDGLQSGRWIIVSGERTDIKNPDGSIIAGINTSELAMIAEVNQAPSVLPGDKIHTTLTLAKPLAHAYKLDSVAIYANVVKATHGETRNETLGAGDSSKALQVFSLKQPPLTFVSAANISGVDSTLKVYVNDVEWKETDSLSGLGAKDRMFITKTDDDGKTTIIFGNGKQGVRLPTGLENIKAVYRNGIGKQGNVKAGQISLLQTRPLGVKAVNNPIEASGGADKETRDQARENAPLAVKALDRLVSVTDYADFTRTFAGIGKAVASKLSNGRRQLVHITIAGVDDIPIEISSDLYRNLQAALRQLGDPDLALQVEKRELIVLAVSANIRLVSGYLWEPVKDNITAAVFDAFSFQRRKLGQPALLCELIALMQNIPGVDYVDVDSFNGIPEIVTDLGDGSRGFPTLSEINAALGNTVPPPYYILVNDAGIDKNGVMHPAQLAIFTPSVPDTIVLKQR